MGGVTKLAQGYWVRREVATLEMLLMWVKAKKLKKRKKMMKKS